MNVNITALHLSSFHRLHCYVVFHMWKNIIVVVVIVVGDGGGGGSVV